MAKQVQSGLDRISSLSDDILCHILSFLPAKDAVGTCILSTRWRYLFASISSLDFDFENNWEGSVDAFMNFVDRVLLLRKRQSVDRFRLNIPCLYRYSFDLLRVEGWIRAVLWHSIEELNLSIELRRPNQLPTSLFTCKTLVVLKLSWISLRVPASVYLPSLKVFHVKSCCFHDDFGEWLSIGCPVLEELIVEAEFLWPLDWCKVNISSSTLKRLTIEIGCESGTVEIIINAPSLVYLQYCGYDDNHLAVINVPFLVEARIDFCQANGTWVDYHTFATHLMKGISNIHALNISDGTLSELNQRMVPLSLFQNLTYLCILPMNLEYIVYQMEFFLGLHHLLLHSNHLETLVFKHLPNIRNTDSSIKLKKLRAPRPFLSCLKTIEIFSFEGFEAHIQIVKYFLKNAKVLENLTIHINREKKQLKVTKQLLMFPRASTRCKVIFV